MHKLPINLFLMSCLIHLGVDYCAKGHDCHKDAECSSSNTKYTCKCNKGFQGNGTDCTGR